MSADVRIATRIRFVGGHRFWHWPIADTDNSFDAIADHWEKGLRDIFLGLTQGRRGVVVQAGGNCGMYPLLLSDHFKRVYTFEPDGDNFHCLVLNCEKGNIVKAQLALGSVPGMGYVHRRWPGNTGAHQINPAYPIPTGDLMYIPIITIDSLGLDQCDFIQLDVEGREHEVLLGATGVISAFHPIISVERATSPVFTLLGKLGYTRTYNACDDTVFITG